MYAHHISRWSHCTYTDIFLTLYYVLLIPFLIKRPALALWRTWMHKTTTGNEALPEALNFTQSNFTITHKKFRFHDHAHWRFLEDKLRPFREYISDVLVQYLKGLDWKESHGVSNYDSSKGIFFSVTRFKLH